MVKVLKFGGSSVADATAISRVLDIVEASARDGKIILVLSAISGCTDALLSGDEKALEAIRSRHLRIIGRLFTGEQRDAALKDFEALFSGMKAAPESERVTFGELFSTTILSRKLSCEGFRTVWVDSRKCIIKGDISRTYSRIREAVAADADIFVAPGFIASTPDGVPTTLGRGGSDYSAALYAAAVNADSVEIWTDVPGIMTANPKKAAAARTVPLMSYSSALRMADGGAKVLYPPTVAPARDAGIGIRILNTFAPSAGGTLVSGEEPVPGWVGVADREDGLVTLVGGGLEEPSGAVPRVVEALRRSGIQPLSCETSGSDILIRVAPAVLHEAVKAVHREFFETAPVRNIRLFIAGAGAVASALLETIGKSAPGVVERTGKRLVVCGIASSKLSLVEKGGLEPSQALESLSARGDTLPFVEKVLREEGEGAFFVDCTDSHTIYRDYERLLEKGFGVVSSNRRSFAVPFVSYAALKAASLRSSSPLRYETTVGAALPVLESISRSANASDEIVSIEAVVSCTLNRILSEYRAEESFASLVRKASRDGITEPDPRVDLGGGDALRKLLILAREAGIALEASDVAIEPVTGGSLEGLSIEEVFDALEEREEYFAGLYHSVADKGLKLRFTASLERPSAPGDVPSATSAPSGATAGAFARTAGTAAGSGVVASIRLKAVDQRHPAYHLRGTENAIIVRSAFHPYPLVISGAGEGPGEAASSLLNDILR